MDIDQASTFFVGSILVMLGFIVVAAGIVVINNLFAKYWKPVNWTLALPEYIYVETKEKIGK
jgi:hypothetical protein